MDKIGIFSISITKLVESLNEKDKNGYTPLHFAVQSGNLKLVK